jgi:cytochrome b561
MQMTNTVTRYGAVIIVLHWFMALLIIGMLGVGLYMVGVPVGLLKLKLYGWHKEFGILVLMLVTFRIGWRLTNVTPALPLDMPWIQKFLAHSVHLALYLLMFAMPITGWLMTSAAGLPPSFFGLFVLPPLVAPNQDLFKLFVWVHTWLAYGFIGLICAHAGAALQHHFIEKDNILRRILP